MTVLPHAKKHATIISRKIDHLLWHWYSSYSNFLLKSHLHRGSRKQREDSSAQWQSHDATDLPQHQFADHHRGLIFEVLAEKENSPTGRHQSTMEKDPKFKLTCNPKQLGQDDSSNLEPYFEMWINFQGASSIPDFGRGKNSNRSQVLCGGILDHPGLASATVWEAVEVENPKWSDGMDDMGFSIWVWYASYTDWTMGINMDDCRFPLKLLEGRWPRSSKKRIYGNFGLGWIGDDWEIPLWSGPSVGLRYP